VVSRGFGTCYNRHQAQSSNSASIDCSQSRRYVLFRVHRSNLAHHSAFFCDLFSLPQPLVDAAPSPSAAYEKRHTTLEIYTTNELEGCRVPISRAVYRNHDLSCSHCPSHSTLIFVMAAFCRHASLLSRIEAYYLRGRTRSAGIVRILAETGGDTK